MTLDDKTTILVVDDEEPILEIVGEFFEQRGYRVLTARNGLEAVEVLGREKIHCCFTDINMPEMNGLELAEYIRVNDNTIPVVSMTGYPSLESTIHTLKNGVVDYLIKPVNLEQMEVCVRRVLRERNLFIENILLKKEVDGKNRLEALNRELMNKVEELNNFNKIMSDFTAISSSDELFRRVVDLCIEVVNAAEARFFIISDLSVAPFEVISAKAGGQYRVDPVEPPQGADFERIVQGVAADELPLLVKENRGVEGLPASITSFMAVPLKIREKVFGVLTAAACEPNVFFSQKDLYYLSFMCQKAAYGLENLALYENIYENLFATLSAFVTAVEARDAYTNQHSSRVTDYSVIIGQAMGCSKEELDILTCAGHLHDIGKIGIRDDILLKPARLTAEEFEVIKEHPEIGANIVGQLGLWEKERQIIRHHHERYDGTGYPDGLSGEEIPFLARILSVADAYDAMASDRAYRRRMPEEDVLSIIRDGAGSQFDPQVVETFMVLHGKGALVASPGQCVYWKREGGALKQPALRLGKGRGAGAE
ncbi:MAG: transcriptional regulator [Deltaproteobacteria bacterium]|nr:MAG: transcriptional regulator [Deltaproteobacteria bacterium]